MERIVAAVVLAANLATAQHVTVVPRAPAALTAGVVYGGQPFNHVVPPGPLPWQGHVTAGSPYVQGSIQGASTHMHWTVQTPAVLLTPDVRITAGFSGLVNSHIGPSVASLGPNEIIFDVSATTQRDAFLEIELTGNFTGASQWPTWEVDVGNDGIPEAYFGNGVAQLSMQLGPTPVPISLRCSVGIGTPNPTWSTSASMNGNVEMKLTADNRVSISEVFPTCGTATLECRQAFAHDGVIFSDNGGGPLKVLVLGLQPAPMPFSSGVSPCILWPSPDVVLGPITTLDVPIPAAVRPFTFYAQSIYAWNFFGPQLSASQALRIFAY